MWLVSEGFWSVDGVWGVALGGIRNGQWESSKSLLETAIKQEWATPDLHAQMAELYLMQGNHAAAVEALNKTIALEPSDPWLYFELGQVYEQWANAQANQTALLETALAAYGRANELDPTDPFVLDRLIRVNSHLGRNTTAQEWRVALSDQISSRHPEYPAREGEGVSQEWVVLLEGYDLQEKALEWSVPVPLCLWWSGDVYVIGDNVHQVANDKWIQCVRVPNLVSNGGFELDGGTGPMFPSGYVRDVYVDTPLTAHGVSFDPLGERTGKVVWLANDASRLSTGLASGAIAVSSEGRIYLQGAWVRSAGGRGRIGYRPLGGTRTQHAFNNIKSDRWRYYSRLIGPEADAAGVELRLSNYRASDSVVYFDDVLFVELEPPVINVAD